MNHSYSSSLTKHTLSGLSKILLLVVVLTGCANVEAIPHRTGIASFEPTEGSFPLAQQSQPVPMLISPDDYPGVIKAFSDLQKDIERVTGTLPAMSHDNQPSGGLLLIAGTLGNNPVIDALVENGFIDTSELEGKWEKFVIQAIDQPFPDVERALVITGSDKRGTIFGIYELSKQIGVSPWFWWADVPVPQQSDVYIDAAPHTIGEPGVQYRGIFINNENPALLNWVEENYGWFTHEFYVEVFELILRNQGNYLWPAMWGKAFHDDDPLNPKLADEYGIVIGYSHHEPMMRSHIEWDRYGEGPWDYNTNAETLREFWIEGIERIKDYETTVTLGMRGDGDEPMSDDRNIELLEGIVSDQRDLLDEYAQNQDNILQYWALYKEVQEYYEMGMEVPEDVMIFLANDNWGNIRLLPDPETAHEREGGWGMYYHFDYVGGPRNYKWINTIQISRIWEQMNLAWQHDVNRLWLVNVGDIKPMEFPISFFLDFAWNPDNIDADAMNRYPVTWAKQQFGPEYAEEIGYLLTEYTRINSRRKPELLGPETYSLIHFREWERVVADYNALADKSSRLYDTIPAEYRDAYYQLVHYPVVASANLNELYKSTAKNHFYATQERKMTNVMAKRVEELFHRDRELSDYYNFEMADGKWKHMMDQTRIGYTYWQQPEINRMPYVNIVHTPPYDAVVGISVEGSEQWWPHGADSEQAKLPAFDAWNKQVRFIELFNRRSYDGGAYQIQTDADWLRFSSVEGTFDLQKRIDVSVDWNRAPEGQSEAVIRVTGTDGLQVEIIAEVMNPRRPWSRNFRGFVESDGYVAMEAPHYTRSVAKGDIQWKQIPQLGRTLSSMSPFPVLAESQVPGQADTPRLEYDMYLFNSGEVTVRAYLSPTKNYSKNYRNPDGIHFGVSFNDEKPHIVNMHDEMIDGFDNQTWYRWVAENTIAKETTHVINKPGQHTLKIWMQDSGVVLQRIVVETDSPERTYLGPPESFIIGD